MSKINLGFITLEVFLADSLPEGYEKWGVIDIPGNLGKWLCLHIEFPIFWFLKPIKGGWEIV